MYILATPLYVILKDNHDSRVERVDNRNYLRVDMPHLKKEFFSPRTFTRALKEIVFELKNCGLYTEAKEVEDRIKKLYEFENTEEKVMEFAWNIISDYVIDKQ